MDSDNEPFTEQKGVILIRDIISAWSQIYQKQVFFLDYVEETNEYQYEVEFSKPIQQKPIPNGTVKIFFSIYDQFAQGDKLAFEFHFENESLIHKLETNTMRTKMFESWINNLLEKKFKI